MKQIKERAEEDQDLYRENPRYPKKSLHVSLPIPPSVNHMYVRTRYGGNQLSKRSQEYVRTSRALINLAIEEQKWLKQNKYTWLYVDLVFFMPDRRIRDSHNCLKLLMDVMQDIVFENDYTVMPRIQGVEYDKDNPRVEVHVTVQSINNRDKGLKIAGIY